MKCVWEELDSINVLTMIANVSPKISLFLSALSKQKEEQRLFQFLNGLDEHYSNQRSQILMIAPLPSVENACSMLQQEESQRVLFGYSLVETTALLSKGKFQEKCSICGFKWHPLEKCWEKVDYPSWHPKYKVSKQFKTRDGQNRGQDDDAEFPHNFAAGIAYLSTQLEILELLEDWIYDTGATDHMTPDSQCVVSFYPPLCMVHDLATKRVTGLGKLKFSLYHLLNVLVDKVDQVFSSLVKVDVHKFSLSAVSSLNSLNKTDNDTYALWHHRLGHVSDSKLKHMKDFPVVMSKPHSVKCLSCPMAKFAKLPYAQSYSHSLRSDNALEFVKGECGLYLQSQGDCVTTATYLINRLPSSVLKNKTPYEILLGQVPSYSHLRVFGCFAIVSNLSRIPDKFAPRGTLCVILAYPFNKKGSGYQQKDRKPSQNDKTEHGMEKTVQNQGQSPKMPKSESILKNQQSNRSRN
ncbi:cysteine-rich receptor-like protein kinase 8 [Tanacetum coccineum]